MILTITTIVLVVLLAVATIFFGGDIFFDGKKRADASKVVNDISQIEGAIEVFRAREGGQPSTQSDLAPEYLKTIPVGWEADTNFHGFLRFDTDVTPETCAEVNDLLGIENPGGDAPTCDPNLGVDEGLVFRGCCIAPPAGG